MAGEQPVSMKQSLNRFYNRWQGKPVLTFVAKQQPQGGVVCKLVLPTVKTTCGCIGSHEFQAEAAYRKLADAAACKDAWGWLQVRSLSK